MQERVSNEELQEMLDIMDEGESYLPEVDIEAALHDLMDVRSGKALKDSQQRIAELEHERDEARKALVWAWKNARDYKENAPPDIYAIFKAARAAGEDKQ